MVFCMPRVGPFGKLLLDAPGAGSSRWSPLSQNRDVPSLLSMEQLPQPHVGCFRSVEDPCTWTKLMTLKLRHDVPNITPAEQEFVQAQGLVHWLLLGSVCLHVPDFQSEGLIQGADGGRSSQNFQAAWVRLDSGL